MPGFKKSNQYASLLPASFYAAVPKAVFAAIAVSPAVNLGVSVDAGDDLEPARYVLREWQTLHSQGIVPQAPISGKKWGLDA